MSCQQNCRHFLVFHPITPVFSLCQGSSLFASPEKRYHCKYCSYCTDYATNLTFHERRHTGERPFQCTVCKKAYARKDHLKRHMEMHPFCNPQGTGRADGAVHYSRRGGGSSHGRHHQNIRTYGRAADMTIVRRSLPWCLWCRWCWHAEQSALLTLSHCFQFLRCIVWHVLIYYFGHTAGCWDFCYKFRLCCDLYQKF